MDPRFLPEHLPPVEIVWVSNPYNQTNHARYVNVDEMVLCGSRILGTGTYREEWRHCRSCLRLVAQQQI